MSRARKYCGRLRYFLQLHFGVSLPSAMKHLRRLSPQQERQPLVSVVITCYNYGNYLVEAVSSILAQSYRNYEIIIVNDGSTDNTRHVAESLIGANPCSSIFLINQDNSGHPAIARNRGIAHSRGLYLVCLDADDMIAPEFLTECVAVLESDPTISIAYTDQVYFDDACSREVGLCRYNLRRLLQANFISCCSVFRREAWEDAGGYRAHIGYEDWDFWISCAEHGHIGKRIAKPLFWYRQHTNGVYASDLKKDSMHRATIILNHPGLYGEAKIRWATESLR